MEKINLNEYLAANEYPGRGIAVAKAPDGRQVFIGYFIMALPSDPIMLLSVVNLKLRDFYPSLDALCDDMDADRDALCKALSAVGYAYDAARNQFI